MTKDTRVQTREICTNCTTGVVSSPVWEKYWETWDKHRLTFIDQQKVENWSSSRFNDTFDEWEKEHPYPECSEEEPCPECEGNRVILKWVSVKEFGDLLFSDVELFGKNPLSNLVTNINRNHSHPCCEEKND